MVDYWENMEEDKDAQERIKKSVELLDAKEGMRVLDIGCHKCESARYLPDKVFYEGIDIEQNHPRTIKMDIDGGFDFPEVVDRILCLETLEHLVMPNGTLRDMAKILDPEGIAVVSLPNEATLFHRLRALLGIVDMECFSYGGKHLHLPSLSQSRAFLQTHFDILTEAYYIPKELRGIRQPWIRPILRLIPNQILQTLANLLPSLFARGFIFKLKKK